MVQKNHQIDFVFVHLNSQIPKYLRQNLANTLKQFPNQKVVLIHNVDLISPAPRGVSTFKYTFSHDVMQIDKVLTHPKNFRGNFWLTSIARFDALRQYLESLNTPIIHIESDVILAGDFPYEKFLHQQENLLFPVVAPDRGVASTLFIRNFESANSLVSHAIDQSRTNSSTTDMEILASLNERINSTIQLPFATPSAFNACSYLPDRSRASLERGVTHFGGLFDGNDFGVYLFGFDPRNRRGLSTVRSDIPRNYQQASKCEFVYDKSRRFISVIDGNEIIPIYSIHATCKKSSLFKVNYRSRLLIRAIRDQHKKSKDVFSPVIFIKMGFDKLVTYFLRKS